MPDEVIVHIPTPEQPPPPPSTDHSLAIEVGRIAQAQQATHDLLLRVMDRLDAAAPPAAEPANLESRLERLEEQNESDEQQQPPAVTELILPPPEHHELPAEDPTTPASTPPAPQEKRFLGMLHAW